MYQPPPVPPPPPMESPSWTAYAAAWLATLALILLSCCLRRRRNYNLPPGPKPWPIIGNLNLIGPLPHRSLHKLSKTYGPLMQLRFGSFPVVVFSSVEGAKAVLKTNDVAFADRPKTAAGKYTAYNYSDITWSPYGPYWRQARKILIMELVSVKRLESYEYIRTEELMSFLKNLYLSRGAQITLKDHLFNLTLNVMSRIVLGKKYTEETENPIIRSDVYKKMIEELFVLNGTLNIGDSIPWLDFLDLQGYIKRMKAVHKKFNQFLEHVLDEHNERRCGVANFVPKDMVDVLLQLANDTNLEVKIDRTRVKAFIQDLLAGETESSSTTVEWTISELLKRPKIIKKAIEELDRVIKRDRWVSEKDIMSLPYIDAITKEAMRLHPRSPMLVPRMAREDCKIDGYDIPKGTQVLVHVWSIARDPEIWDAPNEFRPERFLGQDIDVKGQSFELLPFGSGRRMCPGYSLGLKVIQTTLANLLHGFNWKLPGGMSKEDLDMEEIFGLSTPKKIPLVAVAEPRLPDHMYSL
ncbi:trimethyltridecatetraene synthase-like [Rhodamnia argentea]|uniref:Trimethyltridecatetraene synthase-like n=1 Tax=Rhodamnia argentea TaxID=178133 RepID=A0ABM3HVI4_9MYRT|nr:trimethyltridecatetraene synthase-like [Rhodamnia argentea]